MAAGDGGFSNQINGFNKNEVNEYIGKISKEKKELENELKAAEDKIKAAEKRASEAEAKISSSKEESDKQIAELNAQVKEERKKSEEYINQIDELKRKLKNGGKISSDPNADKQAAEIIAKAKAQAAQIVEDAKKNASKSSGASAVDTAAFMAALNSFRSAVTNEMQKFSSKAGEILKTPVTGMGGFGAGSFDNSSASLFENMDDGMDSGMGSSDVTAASGLDMSGMGDMMDAVSEVAPLDDPEKPQHEMVDSFDNELLAQTVPTAAADNDMFSGTNDIDVGGTGGPVGFDMGSDSDSSQSDLDAMNALLGQMSASLESAGGSSMGMDSMDNMNSFEEPKNEEPAAAADDNPWANLQAQLDAMEKSGDYGSDEQGNESQPDITSDAQEAPSADDSSIWNFGGDSSSSSDDDDMSDDMSADLFGSF